MKRVDNSDVNIKLDSRIVYLSNFNAKFYTVNAENFFIRKTQDNVISAETEDNDTEYYIKLDWNELVTLGEGVLQYKIVNNVPDSDRADLYFNKNLERTTEYYINSNVTVDPESEQSYAEIIAELGVKIDTVIARSTRADTVHDEAIQDEVITRQQNVSDLTDLISANTSGITQNRSDIGDLSTELSNEITNRQNADAAISGAVDTVLANYYTKNQVYTKTEVDNAIAAIDVSDQLSGYVQTSAFTSYSASVATEIEDNELSTSEAINDINSRLINIVDKIDDNELATSEAINDLNSRVINIVDNTYTKTEVDNAIAAIDVSSQLSGYVTTSAFTSYSGNLNTNLTNQFNNIDQAILGLQSTKLSKGDFSTYSAATKTVIDGKLDSSAFTEQVQVDWDELDSSKLSYIENKPFGIIDEWRTLFDNSITCQQNGPTHFGTQIFSYNYYFTIGKQVKVTIDDSEFVVIAKAIQLNGNWTFTLNLDDGATMPFNDTWSVYGTVSRENWYYGDSIVICLNSNAFNVSAGSTVNLKIEVPIESIKQIDNRYINYSGDTYIQSLVTRIEELETQVNEWKNNGISAGDY